MPLELLHLEGGRRVLSPGDRGFIVCLSKIKWSKHAASEALKFLKSFAQEYYYEKCPESKPVASEEEEVQVEESEGKGRRSFQTQNSTGGGNTSGIQFVQRELVFNTFCFIATNLPDPSDYAYFLMMQLTDGDKYPKSKFPFRIMPVQDTCEARPKAVERAAIPLIERTLGVDDDQPYRYSILYRGNSEADNLTQNEAKAIVRNCVWAINPNCVQCIKYQDYAILIDIVAPLFCIGIAKDYQRLAGYNTWTIRNGLDLTDQKEDSEDDISDISTLDEEEDKQRKLKLKRKRRAEMTGLWLSEGEPKRDREGEEEKEEAGEEQELEMQENEAGDAVENGV